MKIKEKEREFGLEMNRDSEILVPAPAVRLMKSRVLSRPGVNSVPWLSQRSFLIKERQNLS
jgi:hypothetical protein